MFGINISPRAPAISSISPEIKRKLVEKLRRLQSGSPQEAAAGPMTPNQVMHGKNLGGAVEIRLS